MEKYTIQVGAQPMDFKFHCENDNLLVSTISGHLGLYKLQQGGGKRKYENMTDEKEFASELWRMRVSKNSCRGVSFDGTGDLAITVSKGDIMTVDVQTGKALSKMSDGHESDINKVLAITESAFIAADDGGTMKIWDTRMTHSVYSFQHHQDAVSDVVLHDKEDCLIAVSEDGTMSVTDMKKLKLRAQSEGDEAELLSVTTAREGDKVVCGSSEGVLGIFSWGYFDDVSDRYPGHKEQIDCIQKVDESLIITGCADGKIRLLRLLPNKLICEVGEHKYPVECMSLSTSQKYLASSTHSPVIQLWDVSQLVQRHSDGRISGSQEGTTAEEMGDIETAKQRRRKGKRKKAAKLFKQASQKPQQNIFEDLVHEQ
eukprot:TRINITY_DN22168_c0_g1_i1.p1 TRINITY_DN22168_c0_g1~~TRINITY_DN22168_c0_g1_i1.p1  ORF type:complete len:371 (-),score=72.51 TRINITY_DN22168_c0_g1_i1:41-1153(-)